MRNLSPQRDLGFDGRQMSIQRINSRPGGASTTQWYRTDTGGSTARGRPTEKLIAIYKSRVDAYGLRRIAREQQSSAGVGGYQVMRFEVPYPTDENGTLVDCRINDRVVYNGVSFICTDIIVDNGALVGMLETAR